MKRLFIFFAESPIEQLPEKLSKIKSLSSEYVLIKYSHKAIGFCVSCIEHFCLSDANFNTSLG